MCTFNTKIYRFIKTEHFLQRQWERGIDDELLFPLLKMLPNETNAALFAISYQIVKTYCANSSIILGANQCLFIKVDNYVLITCFVTDLKEYIFGKSRNEVPIIL